MITTLKSAIAETPKRVESEKQEGMCLCVQVRQETYAWLCSIAGEHGIGGALDLMAEIHGLVEKAVDPLGEIMA